LTLPGYEKIRSLPAGRKDGAEEHTSRRSRTSRATTRPSALGPRSALARRCCGNQHRIVIELLSTTQGRECHGGRRGNSAHTGEL